MTLNPYKKVALPASSAERRTEFISLRLTPTLRSRIVGRLRQTSETLTQYLERLITSDLED